MKQQFELVTRNRDYPYRDRALFDHYIAFADGRGLVLAESSLLAELRHAATSAAPRETGGLIVGRVFRDDAGPYTVLLGAVEASSESGAVGHFTMTPDVTAQLRSTAALRYPDCDVVGWWHTHATQGGFSNTDHATQRLFDNPHHVGFLVFASGTHRAHAYLGPAAGLLTENQQAPQSTAAPPADHRRPIGGRSPARQRPRWQPWLRLLIGLVALGGAAGVVLRNEPERTSSAEAVITRRNSAVAWSCVPMSSERYGCGAQLSGPGEIEWRLDGDLLGKGTLIPIPPFSEPVRLHVVVRGTGGALDGGTQVLIPLPVVPAAPSSDATGDPVTTTNSSPAG